MFIVLMECLNNIGLFFSELNTNVYRCAACVVMSCRRVVFVLLLFAETTAAENVLNGINWQQQSSFIFKLRYRHSNLYIVLAGARKVQSSSQFGISQSSAQCIVWQLCTKSLDGCLWLDEPPGPNVVLEKQRSFVQINAPKRSFILLVNLPSCFIWISTAI